ncbi:MAG: 50S ribosomal protein L4, partial [Bacteroidota bacterium]
MRCQIINLSGSKVKDIDLNPNVFNVEFNPILFKEVIEFHNGQSRQATYGTKNRSELNYSTKKLRRQKGSGRSRVGPRGAPQYRKGAVVFGPDGRTYDISIPKKKKTKALAMCLTKKLVDNEILFLDQIKMEKIKTKGFIEI